MVLTPKITVFVKKNVSGNLHGYPFELLANPVHHTDLGGARVYGGGTVGGGRGHRPSWRGIGTRHVLNVSPC